MLQILYLLMKMIFLWKKKGSLHWLQPCVQHQDSSYFPELIHRSAKGWNFWSALIFKKRLLDWYMYHIISLVHYADKSLNGPFLSFQGRVLNSACFCPWGYVLQSDWLGACSTHSFSLRQSLSNVSLSNKLVHIFFFVADKILKYTEVALNHYSLLKTT